MLFAQNEYEYHSVLVLGHFENLPRLYPAVSGPL